MRGRVGEYTARYAKIRYCDQMLLQAPRHFSRKSDLMERRLECKAFVVPYIFDWLSAPDDPAWVIDRGGRGMAGVNSRKGIIGDSVICRHSYRTPRTYSRTSGKHQYQSSFSSAVEALRRVPTPPGGLRHSILDGLSLAMRFSFIFFFVSSSSELFSTKIYFAGPYFYVFLSTAFWAVSMIHVVRRCFGSYSIREGITIQRAETEVKCYAR